MRIIPRILFIDDDKFFLEFYRAELSQFNLSTEFAQDGEEGVEKAKKMKPDAILLDILLPKKDGFEVLRELKEDETTKNIPVIVISTLNSEPDTAELMSLGAVCIFNKLSTLPKDVAAYVQRSFESGKFELGEKQESSKKGTVLPKEKINEIFKESLEEIEKSFVKIFSKKTELRNLNVSLIPLPEFRKNIDDIAKEEGTIFIYSDIEAREPGIVILAMKKNAALALIKLIGEGVTGKKDIELTVKDQVVEEFFNIIVNAFLSKLSHSVPGKLILKTPIITDSKMLLDKVETSKINDKDRLVVFLEEAHRIEELDLNFSLFVTFGNGLFI
ncbi:MAG: response regulator [Candidatus Pacebacteria bacterium]|nr:response regulator [Candidatus Paceibacterota bacterium]